MTGETEVAVENIIALAREKRGQHKAESTEHADWPAPKELPSKLARVAQFDIEFLPPSIAPWVADISERLQCPAGLRCYHGAHRPWVAYRATCRD